MYNPHLKQGLSLCIWTCSQYALLHGCQNHGEDLLTTWKYVTMHATFNFFAPNPSLLCQHYSLAVSLLFHSRTHSIFLGRIFQCAHLKLMVSGWSEQSRKYIPHRNCKVVTGLQEGCQHSCYKQATSMLTKLLQGCKTVVECCQTSGIETVSRLLQGCYKVVTSLLTWL